ncbi:hypothetical protein SCP_1103160 [Sparassis crispa]|uniref:Uncharacterized protein n=1 Tax=Sparassis crispa TaxID=139825 RepID=A0A401GZS5_9APHY|nr:hypothetical protein SCP_1103160 [Sparassis crispa]GBE87639.1 hypothetical protein SCP_1103160 [Sparassis crispa]
MFCPSPVFHDITNPSDWPHKVQEVVHLLSQPLPNYISTGPWPFVSPLASYLLNELSQDAPRQRAFQHEGQSVTDSVSRLNKVFDLVLSTVAALRELESLEDCGPARPTVPLWSLFFKGVGIACSPESCYMDEVSFVLPQLSPRSSQVVFDGIATLLISHIVDESQFVRSRSSSDAMDVDAFSEPEDDQDGADASSSHNSERISIDGTHSTADSEGDYADDQDSTDETSQQPSGPSIDVPFDAHVLRGSGRRLFAVLPVICVADSDNIGALVTSVAYQRRVWDIDEPVVGFEVSKTGAVARILLGWVGAEVDGDFLPAVNIACATTHSYSGMTVGVFDLTDPQSALALAQFVLGLDAHCWRIVSKSKHRPVIDAFHWRSDYLEEHEDSCNNGDLGTRIANWASTIDTRGDGGNPEAELDLSTSPASDMSDLSMILESPGKPTEGRGRPTTPRAGSQTGSGAKKSHSRVKEEAVATKGRSRTPASDKASQKQELKAPKSRSASVAPRSERSSSVLAKKVTTALDGSVTPSTWLFERKAFPIALIKLPPNAEDADEINEKIDTYRKIVVEFAWRSGEWSSVDTMPQVDEAVQPVLERLFQNYSALKEKPVNLDEADMHILSSRFSTILYASMGAYTHHAASSGLRVNEAEARHDWDRMLYQFCVSDSGRIVSPYILLERELIFPRNKAVDLMLDDDSPEKWKSFAEKQEALALSYYTHCVAVQVPSVLHGPAVGQQAIAASGRALSFFHQIGSVSRDPSKMLDMFRKHAASEPLMGICDAIVVCGIKDAFDNKDSPATRKFLNEQALVQHTLTMRRKKDQSTEELVSQTSSHPQPPTPATEVRPKKASALKTTSAPKTTSASKTTSTRSRAPSAQSALRKSVGDPFMNSCSPLISKDQSNDNSTSPRDTDAITRDADAITRDQLLLPVLVAEYKRWDEDQAKSLNQGRFYCVASVTFLAALGIEGYPVFTLITNGKVGAVLLSWQSQGKKKKIYIIERNVCTFDLADPLQAFHFATFLVRLRRQHRELKALFEKEKANFRRKVSAEQFDEWMMAAQDVILKAQQAAADAAAASKADTDSSDARPAADDVPADSPTIA